MLVLVVFLVVLCFLCLGIIESLLARVVFRELRCLVLVVVLLVLMDHQIPVQNLFVVLFLL